MKEIKTIQISKHTTKNTICVYRNHSNIIAELNPSDFAAAFNWYGDEVITFFLDVLTDCNYHTERKIIESTLKI